LIKKTIFFSYLSAFFAPHQLETMSAGEMSHYFRLKAKDGGQPSSSSIFARFIETLHECHPIGPDGLFCAPTREKELISAATASQQGKRIAKAVNKIHGDYEEAHRTMNYLSPNAPNRQQIGYYFIFILNK
jgi:hypothetical protein